MFKLLSFTAVFFSCFLLLSCSSQYIGRSVQLSHQAVCTFDILPAKCNYTSQHFAIEYEISTTENTDEYFVSGSAVDPGGATGTWTDFSNANFTLILVNDGIVIETLTIAGGTGSLGEPITFSRTFKTKNSFQATLISYDMDVSG
jgi:hypothetical protein